VSFVLVVRINVKEGLEEEAVATARELAAATRTEPGCEAYVPCRDPENPRSILIYEQYRDQAAFEEHGASEHFQRLAAGRLWEMLESRERTFYETL
jgi:quinol monooxygenase YgiN